MTEHVSPLPSAYFFTIVPGVPSEEAVTTSRLMAGFAPIIS